MSIRNNWRLSATRIKTFKACPMRHCLKYIKRVYKSEEQDALRMGTNWHTLLEVYSRNNDFDEAIKALDDAYENKPISKSYEDWEAEKAKLAYSLSGYIWYYQNDEFETLAREIPFSLKLINPETGATLPNVTVDGVIDKIIRKDSKVMIEEHKSTSSSVEQDSKYWGSLRLDTQTTLYEYAAIQLQKSGTLEQFGIKADDPMIQGALYDVWRKPGISPKKITQALTAELIETGEYCGGIFKVAEEVDNVILVNGVAAEVEVGKKANAIRETADMYGARLLQDIQERPEFYFARKPLSRTTADMKRFQWELYNIYQTARNMDKNDAWYCDESQCEATYHCDYIPICYNNINVDEYLPEGFVRKETTDDKAKSAT